MIYNNNNNINEINKFTIYKISINKNKNNNLNQVINQLINKSKI